MGNNQRVRNDGFTLIELLIVIAIIAVLIAILLPSLGTARESGRLVKCASRQRQLAMATTLYQNENDDWYAPIQDRQRVGNRVIEGTWRVYLWEFYGRQAQAVDCPSEYNEIYADGISSYDVEASQGNVNREYPEAKGILHRFEMYNAAGIGANLTHYWEDAEGDGPFGRPAETGYPEGLTKAAWLEFPTQCILFADGHGDALEDWPEDRFWLFSWTPGLPVWGPGFDRNVQGDAGAVRHTGKANYAFTDGSVQVLNASDIPCTPEACWWSVQGNPHARHLDR